MIVTFFAQIAVMIGGLLLYRLLAVRTGTNGFGSYALIKQSVACALPLLSVGTAVAVPRFIALGDDSGRLMPEAYLVAGTAICVIPTAIAVSAAMLFPGPTAALFFGDSGRTELVGPLVATAVATVAVGLAYAYLRGMRNFRDASWLQVVGVATSPVLIVLLLPGKSVSTLILVMALVAIACSVAALLPAIRRMAGLERRQLADAVPTLLHYGARRIPADGFEIALLMVAPIVVAHTSSLRDVSYISTGVQLLLVLVIAIKPLGLVILPSLSRVWAVDPDRARKQVLAMVQSVIHVALFLTFQLVLYADIVVRVWLGHQFSGAGPVLRVVVLPTAFFLSFIALRSVIDAVATTAYNSRNNAAAFGVFAAAVSISLALHLTTPVMCVAASFALGIATQGGLALIVVHRLFGGALSTYRIGPAVGLSVLAGALGLGARFLIVHSRPALLWVILFELVLAALYLRGLMFLGVTWPSDVVSALRGVRREKPLTAR